MFAARERFYRWVPAFSMLLVSLISYIDRTTLALLAPTILKETRLSGQEYGFIISAFSVAYMLSNPLWGRILDRAGLRRGMNAAVTCWTAASMAHAFASGFWSFGLARAALGFGEGATFPGGLRAVVQTLPPEQRGRGLAVAYSGGSLGAVITPLIVTPIFVRWGWRGAFWFTGVIGVAWLAIWTVVGRRPDIAVRRPDIAATTPAPHLRDRTLWAFMCAYALGALPLGFVLYSASLYLAHPLGYSQQFIGKVLWIPPLGWEVGYFVWGSVCDRSLKQPLPRVRSLGRLMTICVLLNLAFATVPWLPNVAAVMFVMFLAMFVSSGFVVLSVAYATHVYSQDHAGLIAGAGAGSWSAVVALMMPLFGRLFDLHLYSAAFAIATAIPLLGYGFWSWFARKY
jgi:ACS family hexuronate transporter-like MFS transporter